MILLDFSPLKTGGGVQLALNFLVKIQGIERQNMNYFILLPNSGVLSKMDTKNLKFPFAHAPTSSFLKRAYFEYISFPRLVKRNNVNKVFTFFGAGLPHKKSVKSIVSVAYPIICYDESPYWKYISTSEKVKKKIINFIRKTRLKKANIIIAETEIMKDRLSKTLKLEKSVIKVIPPATSAFLEEKSFKTKNSSVVKFLLLSGYASHKNLWRLLELSSEIEKLDINFDFKFMITGSLEDFLRMNHSVSIDNKLVERRFQFLGSVHPASLQDVYENCNFLINLSDLESFSNNYMEAWKTATPLIVSDRDFARSICLDSALYIEPHNVRDMAYKIISHVNNPELIERMVKIGKELYGKLPSQEEKLDILLNIINE